MTQTPKKLYSVYGNCQANALLKTLRQSPRFSEIYEAAPVGPCFTISEDKLADWAQTQAPQVGLLITQKLRTGWRKHEIFDTDWLAAQIPDDARRFQWSDMYYKAYEPHMAFPIIFPKPAFSHYLNMLHLLAYLHDRPWQDVLAFYTDPSIFPAPLLIQMHEAAQDGLAKREEDCSIQITPFLRENFLQERLFITYNHPARATMRYGANQVLEGLGISDPVPEKGWYSFSPRDGQPLLASMEAMLTKKASHPMESSFFMGSKNVTAEEYFSRWQTAFDEIGKETLANELHTQMRDPVMVAPIVNAAACHMGIALT